MSNSQASNIIFVENEQEANLYAARCLRVMALIAALAWLLNLMGIFIVPAEVMNLGIPGCLLVFLLPTAICRYTGGKGTWVKYAVVLCSILGLTILAVAVPKHAVLAWMAPVLLTCHYYSRSLTISALLISVVFMCAAGIASMYVGEGDPNLIGGAASPAEAVITPTIFWETILFFLLPRSATLVGLSFICITIAKRTHGLLEKQAADSSARQRIETELNVAASLQTAMLPCQFPAFPERRDFDIYATMTPAKEVGGDFYDFYFIDGDHLSFTIADVSGKGVPAALFMARCMALLKTRMLSGQSPAQVLSQVNNELCRNNDGMFVTVWLGVLELSTGSLIYANAGHEYPLVRHEGTYRYIRQRPGLVLGGMEDYRYRDQSLSLSPGDAVFQYTDGVTEATAPDKQLFGSARLLEAVNRGAGLPPQRLLPFLQEEIRAFVGEADQFDDITMVALEYRGPQPDAPSTSAESIHT